MHLSVHHKAILVWESCARRGIIPIWDSLLVYSGGDWETIEQFVFAFFAECRCKNTKIILKQSLNNQKTHVVCFFVKDVKELVPDILGSCMCFNKLHIVGRNLTLKVQTLHDQNLNNMQVEWL